MEEQRDEGAKDKRDRERAKAGSGQRAERWERNCFFPLIYVLPSPLD